MTKTEANQNTLEKIRFSKKKKNLDILNYIFILTMFLLNEKNNNLNEL